MARCPPLGGLLGRDPLDLALERGDPRGQLVPEPDVSTFRLLSPGSVVHQTESSIKKPATAFAREILPSRTRSKTSGTDKAIKQRFWLR